MQAILGGIQSPVLGPVYALLAGILTSTSPCTVNAIPLLAGHLAGSERRARARSLVLFVVGVSLSLTSVGLVAGAVGRTLSLTVPAIRWIAGLAFVTAGLAYLGVFGGRKTCPVTLPQDTFGERANGGSTEGSPVERAEGLGAQAGAFAMGALYGFSASPCATPALISILSLVAASGSLTRGALLLLAYSLGQCFLVVLAGVATSRFSSLLERQGRIRVLRAAGGVLVLIVGVYVLARPYFNFP